ncbi:CMP-N-acetylneuraminate-beta-galactosamide-alpha-2,3-sialyltransferase 2-like [Latimeria chalumnae]|uniref:CMP-N-acetylneuraminate-beta-galactosamide-alpha-2,3-sialyltransferase 2 n=1 Tax=Latimeria chalumnae TaxID=7897 RepID=A0A0F7RQ79_LATCH|nr:CMP-N-acetylneuraminate-beta-galactosamide-alpha-2,3-sialyltransferase 2-like [Latimeria chalumnae]CDI70256.1 TPA: alpha2,3-sialyltransferase [Latimeria chalumnae]
MARHNHRIMWLLTIILLLCVYMVIYDMGEDKQKLIKIPSIRRLSGRTIVLDKKLCSCEKCVSEKEESAWFDERFDPNFQPILMTEVQDIPSHALQWWLVQAGNKNYNLSESIAKLFTVVPRTNHSGIRDPAHCRKCAVVGNSGNLKGSNHGKEIDAHHFVIRMNRARTAGFEPDVGIKTTHHLMYPESSQDLQPGVHLVLLPFKIMDFEWIRSALTTGEITRTYFRVQQFIKADKDKVLIINPTFFKYVCDHWTEHHGRYPSTGMTALVFALHICDEVSVFGYGADSNGNWHHYWENNRNGGAFRRTGVHSGDFESQIIKKLADEGKIIFYK